MSAAGYDFAIVGSGIAGLFTAVLAAERVPVPPGRSDQWRDREPWTGGGTGNPSRVAVITKGTLSQTNTRYAQGGIAAAVSAEDSPQLHAQDTLVAGVGLCDPQAVEVLCREGPERVRDLIHLGVAFDTVEGEISLAMEGAHSRRRVLHARGDATGAEIEQALTRRVARAGADLLEHHLLLDLVVEGGRCVGCTVLDLASGETRRIEAARTVLATGGGGRLFAHTTNPAVATADGVAVALRAGAEVADLEFFQFHPTALMKPGAPRFLISEATRGDGAYLLNTRGERFMPRYDGRAELAPRDVVSRAILQELRQTGSQHVWLDLTHLDPARVEAHFPNIGRMCRRYGIEITREPIPVAPAAHYMIGGIRTDVWGRSSLPGLSACGEASSTGVHGANRLASNSLLEAVVFARRIVDAAFAAPAADSGGGSDDAPPLGRRVIPVLPGMGHAAARGASAEAVTAPRLRKLLWDEVSISREREGLARAEGQLRAWLEGYRPRVTRPAVELANMLLVGWQMASAALAREESRGAHYRADFPEASDAWRRRMTWRVEQPQPLQLG